MKILQKRYGVAGLLLIVGLAIAHAAAADTLSGSASSSSAFDLPPTDLSGWFGNGDSGLLFPTPVDPSQPWTSADNLATIAAWDSLIAAADGDPALLAELVGLGMNSMSVSQMTSLQLAVSADSSVTIDTSTGSAESSATPEPALLAFLGGGLSLLLLIAFARLRHPMAIIGTPCRVMKV